MVMFMFLKILELFNFMRVIMSKLVFFTVFMRATVNEATDERRYHHQSAVSATN